MALTAAGAIRIAAFACAAAGGAVASYAPARAADDSCIAAKNATSAYCQSLIAQQRAQTALYQQQRLLASDRTTAFATLLTAAAGVLTIAVTLYFNTRTLQQTARVNAETAQANAATAKAAADARKREWENLRDDEFFKFVDLLRSGSARTRVSGATLLEVAGYAFTGVPVATVVAVLLGAFVYEDDLHVARTIRDVIARLYRFASDALDAKGVAPRLYRPEFRKAMSEAFIDALADRVTDALTAYEYLGRAFSAGDVGALAITDDERAAVSGLARVVPGADAVPAPTVDQRAALHRLAVELTKYRIARDLRERLAAPAAAAAAP